MAAGAKNIAKVRPLRALEELPRLRALVEAHGGVERGGLGQARPWIVFEGADALELLGALRGLRGVEIESGIVVERRGAESPLGGGPL